VRARLAAWIEGVLSKDLASIAAVEKKAEDDNTLRGPAFMLRESLGIRPGNSRVQTGNEVQAKLKAIGARAGRFALYVPDALKPRAMAMRAQLWALSRNIPTPELPPPGLVALPVDGVTVLSWPPGFGEAIGWVPAGPLGLRLDVAERIAGDVSFATRRGPAVWQPEWLTRYGIKPENFAGVLAAMGFRLIEAEVLPEGMFGPTQPARVSWARPERAPRPERGPRPERAPRREGEGEARAPRGPRPDRGPRTDRGPRRDAPPAEAPAAGAPGADVPKREERQPRRPGAPGGAFGKTGPGDRGPRPDGPRKFDGPRGPRDDRPRGPRDDRPRGPRDDRGGNGETRVFHQDKTAVAAEDNPFAKLAALKLK